MPRRIGAALAGAIVLAACVAFAAGPYPLEPVDTASPRATLEGFLDAVKKSAAAYTTDYNLLDRGRSGFWQSVDRGTQFLNLTDIPPAEQRKLGDDAYFHLWEVLSRIELPPAEDIPDAKAFETADPTKPVRWKIPHTPITIARVEKGPRQGEFLFSPETVAQAKEFYQRTRTMPVVRSLGLDNPHRIHLDATGWMIPHSWSASASSWWDASYFDQIAWKWTGLFLLVVLWLFAIVTVHRRLGSPPRGRSLRSYVHRMATPVFTLLTMLGVRYLAERQIGVTGGGEHLAQIVLLIATYLALAWLAVLVALATAEGIISSPKIADRSPDAHLLRLGARVVAILVGCVVVFEGGTQIGLPIYGLLAGLGVGGLAIALATQTTLENFMGSLNLYLDRPIRVGDVCGYDGKMGTVEDIGLRSTRIRGLDDTITTIPNGDFSKVRIINYTRRERILLDTTLRLRLDATDEQVRFILAKLRELLLAHPCFADHEEEAIVRLAGYSETSIDLEILAYAKTSSWFDYLPMREDVLLRMKAIVEEAGTALAVPAQTIYAAASDPLDDARRRQAEQTVAQWREKGDLPFPYFGEERTHALVGTLDYPPDGSSPGRSSRKG